MDFDSRAFRNALGRFPTGVCVVTTPSCEHSCMGVTISSFNSVSLDPPLILWSLSNRSAMLDVFRSNEAFVINVLPEGRDDLAMRFASKDTRTVDSLDAEIVPGVGARLADSIATFDCVTDQLVEAGDHVIFIGRVTEFSAIDDAGALGFFGGRFFAAPYPHAGKGI